MTGLKKVVTLRTVIATSAGMAMATSCYAAGVKVAILVAGQSAWISILVAGIMCILASMCFSELNGMYPSAAGIRLFIERAFGEKVAITIGAFYLGCAIAMVGPETHILSGVIATVLPGIPPFTWVVVFLGLIALHKCEGSRSRRSGRRHHDIHNAHLYDSRRYICDYDIRRLSPGAV